VAAGITGFIYGHEFAGVDDNGTGYFVEPNIYGGKCEQCQTIITHRYPIDDAQEAFRVAAERKCRRNQGSHRAMAGDDGVGFLIGGCATVVNPLRLLLNRMLGRCVHGHS
jgi:hypothetical protein